MHTDSPGAGQAAKGTAPTGGDDIASMICAATRVERQAAVTQESKDGLDTRRTQFEAADEAYSAARNDARVAVEKAKAGIADVLKDLRCRTELHKEALDGIWKKKVEGELKECFPATGCQVFDFKVETAVAADEALWSIAGRITELRYHAKQVDTYFATLIAQQTDLPDIVTQLTDELKQLVTDEEGLPKDQNADRLYARTLVLEWRIDRVWNGFQTVSSYLNCVRSTFAQLLQAWNAIVSLEGVLAERRCSAEQNTAHCAAELKNAVEDMLNRYESAPPATTTTTSPTTPESSESG